MVLPSHSSFILDLFFIEPNFNLSLLAFVHMRHFDIDFLIFLTNFFELVFPIHSVRCRSNFVCVFNENALNRTSGLVLL